MSQRLSPILIAGLLALFSPVRVFAWDAFGHQLVARIAWDHLTATTKTNVITLLEGAPKDGCLLNLFPTDSRPLEVRQREFFVRVSTWPDIVRGDPKIDPRPCVRFHRGDWHFINYFWEGISGATNTSAPRDRHDIPVPLVNVVERLTLFRSNPSCAPPPCATVPEERATILAWLVHLVGDVHQPLHTSARVTTRQNERQGDRGGGLFNLGSSANPFPLHSFWDGIVRFSIRAKQNETDRAYIERVAAQIAAQHPLSAFSGRLQPGDVKAWSLEGLVTTKAKVYPVTLRRGQLPAETYRVAAFTTSKEAIALAAYRLADLLNTKYGS
jgi:hypothetical protein